jgi:MFS family permease
MVLGSALCIFGQVLFASMPLVIASRFVTGMELGVGLVTNVVVAQLSGPERMTRNMMINDIGGSVGSSLGTYLTYLLTVVPFHALIPFDCTVEVQVTIVVALYGLLLGILVIVAMPGQNELERLFDVSSVPPPSSGPAVPSKGQRRPGSALVVAGCLAIAASDALAYRCNISNLVLVLPQEYGFSVEDTSNILGVGSIVTSAAMMLLVATKFIDNISNERLVYGCTLAQLIGCCVLLRMSASGNIAYALLLVAAFQLTSLGNQTKGNALKCHMTAQDVFAKKDVLMVSRLFTMLTAFVGPIAGRYVSETFTAQNMLAVFGGMSICVQLALWTGLQHLSSASIVQTESGADAQDLEVQGETTPSSPLPVLLGKRDSSRFLEFDCERKVSRESMIV